MIVSHGQTRLIGIVGIQTIQLNISSERDLEISGDTNNSRQTK